MHCNATSWRTSRSRSNGIALRHSCRAWPTARRRQVADASAARQSSRASHGPSRAPWCCRVNPSFASIEKAESESWAEMMENVAPAFRERFDLRVQRVAGAITVLAPAGEDIASLNRVWLPGDTAVVTSAALKEIIEYARALGRKRFIAHCPT